MKVLIVDDHPVVQIIIKALVESAFGPCTIVCSDTLVDALAQAGGSSPPDLAILDLGLPDSRGISTLLEFRRTHPAIPAMVLSAEDANDAISDALDAGAVGYLPKNLPPTVMLSALRLVASGGTYIPPQGRSRQTDGTRTVSSGPNLTARQWEVLRLIAAGYDNKSIARELHISDGTVKQHVHALFHTLGIKSRTQAVLFVMRQRSSRAR